MAGVKIPLPHPKLLIGFAWFTHWQLRGICPLPGQAVKPLYPWCPLPRIAAYGHYEIYRKLYLDCQMQPLVCCFYDQKHWKLHTAPTDFGTRWNSNMAIFYYPHLGLLQVTNLSWDKAVSWVSPKWFPIPWENFRGCCIGSISWSVFICAFNTI